MEQITKSNAEYTDLIGSIGELLEEGRRRSYQAVNSILVETYWNIGRYIVEFEQKGSSKAEYGSGLLEKLSKDLTVAYGKGFSKSNLFMIRQFYIRFPIFQTLSGKLTWSHYAELLKIDSDLELNFYVKQCEIEGWGVRELKRQMKSMLFHRLALSTDKDKVKEISAEGFVPEKPADIVKDPYVLEFLDLPQKEVYKEGEIERAVMANLKSFLLELGKGFAFVGEQYVMQIGSRRFKVDLVFYNYYLKCFVLIDLKRGEIEHYDVGQMNMYLNYFKAEKAAEGDNPPIGIILGAYKDKLLMEYATQGIENNLFVSKYQMYLPDREQLEAELEKFMREET